MLPFLRPKLHDGWMSVAFTPDRLDFAHVVRHQGRKPEVLLLNSYQHSGDEIVALRRLRKELKLASYRCTHLLRVGEYQILQVDPPEVPAEEVKAALGWRIKDMLNYPVEAATVDMLEIPVDPGALGRPRQAFAVAANNALLAPRATLFEEAKVPLLAIDIPELALRNISALFEEENRGLAMLACDESGVMMTFTFRGELYAARNTEISLLQLEQAEGERREQQFERIALEAQRSLDNFDRLNGHISVTRLLVSPLPGVPGLVDYLRNYLSLPVAELDLADVLDFHSVPELSQASRQSQCLKALGAALRD